MVTLDSITKETYATFDLIENVSNKYLQRVNKQVQQKNNYKPCLKTKTKYKINNYVSFYKLLESYVLTINQLSIVLFLIVCMMF